MAWSEHLTALPKDVSKRWQIVDELLTAVGPASRDQPQDERGVEHAEERMGVRLPASAREWLLRYGHQFPEWSGNYRWCTLEKLTFQDGMFEICTESNNVVSWKIQADIDDPEVYIHIRGRDIPETDQFSRFALRTVIDTAKFWDPPLYCSASLRACPRVVDSLRQRFQPSDLGVRRWPIDPTTHLIGDATAVELHGDDWLFVASWAEQPSTQFEHEFFDLLSPGIEAFYNRFTGTDYA